VITSPHRRILIRLIILAFLLELRSGLRLKRKAPGTGEESPLAEDPRSPPLSAGYPRFSSHRGNLRFRTWRQRPEGPVQALWPRHCAARMSDPGPPPQLIAGHFGHSGHQIGKLFYLFSYRELPQNTVQFVQGVHPGPYPSATVQLRNR
jgi:hypothetical protein